MEPTRDFSTQKVNNPTGQALTWEEFKEKYRDPKIVAELQEWERVFDAGLKEAKEALQKTRELMDENKELIEYFKNKNKDKTTNN